MIGSSMVQDDIHQGLPIDTNGKFLQLCKRSRHANILATDQAEINEGVNYTINYTYTGSVTACVPLPYYLPSERLIV